MAGETILVLGCTAVTPWGRHQMVRLSEQARRRGLVLVGADSPANLDSARPGELTAVNETVALDVRDPAACRAWAAGVRGIDSVLTFHELSVLPAAVVARELGVPGNDPEAVRCIRTKDLCRQRLREAHFAQPHTAVCASRADAERFMHHTQGPWIVKPRDGLASTGVSLVNNVADLSKAMITLANLSASLGKFGNQSVSPGKPKSLARFLIETYVPGEEFSAEGVLLDGVPHVLALTRKATNDGFIETGHSVPAGLDDASTAAASETVTQAVSAVGITRGVFHVEFWLSERGIVLGEIHARPGGDYLHALVEYSRPGLELYGMLIDDLLGRDPAPVPAQTRAAGADFLLLPPGRLRTVHGWREITRHPDVLAADLLVSPGDIIGPVTDSLDRHGVILVGADETKRVDDLLAELGAQLVVDVNQDLELVS